jgi:ADP-dependent NAD(P)H-hydrate dehydratase / NAD(P)H-hydrate epimerase
VTSADLEVLTVAEMAAADRAAMAAGVSLDTLMDRAGTAVAGAVIQRWRPCPVLVLCGPGDNGGDGFVAARRLWEAGWPVTIAALRPPDQMQGAAGAAARRWREPVLSLEEAGRATGVGLVVDALFGAGLSRPLDGSVRARLEHLQGRGAPWVAVDLPSGLAGDTGRSLDYAPRADLTVTFHRKKPAHVLEPGRELCGEVMVAHIGLEPPQGARLHENAPELWLAHYPWPRRTTHKAARGRLVVVSGPAWTSGAARLAARSGLRAGAGLVTLLSPPDALLVNAAHLEAVMLKPFDSAEALRAEAETAQAAVIGPAAGVGDATRANLLTLADTEAALVVDADVLTSFRADPAALFAALDAQDVMTPHPGEFGRVFPHLLEESPERITAARTAAARAGCVVLLKGADTVIAAPDGRAVVNTNATPWLATAGSGDVLAGIIGGLIAQGMPSFEAACAGAWLHAEAGQGLGPGLISEDLPGRLPLVLADLLERARAHAGPAGLRASQPS